MGLAKEILISGLFPMLSMQLVQGTVHSSYREPPRQMEERGSTSEQIQFGRFSTPRQGFSSSDLESQGAFRHPFFQKSGKGTSRHGSSIQILCCGLLGSRALPGQQRTSWFGLNSTPSLFRVLLYFLFSEENKLFSIFLRKTSILDKTLYILSRISVF